MRGTTGRIASAVVASLLLAGCYATADRSTVEYTKANQVSQVFLVHDVSFAWGAEQLPEVERDRLDGFLAEIGLGYGDVLVLRGGSAGERTSLYRHLVRYGLPLHEAHASDRPGRVRVVVERSVVTPPRCPDWSKAPGNDARNTPGPNLGCASTVNLGRMVANPADLVHGRERTTADGQVLSTAVQRYRVGKTTPLQEGGATTSGGVSK